MNLWIKFWTIPENLAAVCSSFNVSSAQFIVLHLTIQVTRLVTNCVLNDWEASLFQIPISTCACGTYPYMSMHWSSIWEKIILNGGKQRKLYLVCPPIQLYSTLCLLGQCNPSLVSMLAKPYRSGQLAWNDYSTNSAPVGMGIQWQAGCALWLAWEPKP